MQRIAFSTESAVLFVTKTKRGAYGKMSRMDDLEKKLINEPKKSGTDHVLLHFFMGMILLAAGLFMIMKNTYVGLSWYQWRIGGFGIPTGAIVLPLLIGIGILFFNGKSIIGWIVTVVGIVIIVLSIILSVEVRFATTSLYMFVLMFGCTFAGAGLLLRSLFKK